MIILEQDKSFIVMPVCCHPTTVLAVDDTSLLDSLKNALSKNIALLCFDNSEAAIEYVKNARELQIPFASRMHFTGKNDTQDCGFTRMTEFCVQDIIHPFPADIDLSFAKPSESRTDVEQAGKSFDDFKCSQYILTEKSFYYFNKSSGQCDWISSDTRMLKQLSNTFSQEIEGLTDEQLDRITITSNHHRPAKLGFSIIEVRNEPYNRNRFKEIILIISDNEMAGKNGIEFVKALHFPGLTLSHAVIILTQTASDEFKQNVSQLPMPTEWIEKSDPEMMNKLLYLIEKKSSQIFQEHSKKALDILSKDSNEEVSFVFDKGFLDVFNTHIKDNNICEMYLFDRQGSYLFLDTEANLSWFIIRSEKGMENSVRLAIENNAPQSVIDALKERKVVLSLYEESDISRLKDKLTRIQLELIKEKKKKEGDESKTESEIKIEIDWDKYLHSALVFESKTTDSSEMTHKYYYAYTKDFPEHGIDKSRILSYQEFLTQSK